MIKSKREQVEVVMLPQGGWQPLGPTLVDGCARHLDRKRVGLHVGCHCQQAPGIAKVDMHKVAVRLWGCAGVWRLANTASGGTGPLVALPSTAWAEMRWSGTCEGIQPGPRQRRPSPRPRTALTPSPSSCTG
jgi:hypothetical protein